MGLYFVQHEGQQYGPLSREKLQQYFDEGALVADDWAIEEGGAEWVPLSGLVEVAAVVPAQFREAPEIEVQIETAPESAASDFSAQPEIVVQVEAPDIVLAGPAKAVGQQGRIVISSDGGSSWEPAGEGIEEPMTDMVEVFLAGPDGSVWAICAAGRLFRAEPGEWVWQSVGLPESITVESVCFVG